MTYRATVLPLLCSLLAISCFSQDPIVSGKKKFEMYKSPCFGQCPQFNLTIYDDRTAVYEGKSHTKKLGVFKRDLSKSEYKMIKKSFRKAKFKTRPMEYPTTVSDAQTVTLTQHKRTTSYPVKGSIDRPKELIDLEKLMDKIADQGEWLRIKVKEEKEFPNNLIPNVMLIQLKQEVDMQAWLKSYGEYGMTIDRSMVPNMNFMKVIFDLNQIGSQEMLTKVRNDERVHTVSFARKTSGDIIH